jgi:transcriptional regulator with XRE-family HTH domain
MIEAHLERRKPIVEGRTQARRKLRLGASGEKRSGAKMNVLVQDLSATGILLQTSAPLSVAERIEVILPHAGPTAATVVWEGHDLFGCRFEDRISRATLSAAQLRSEHAERSTDAAPRSLASWGGSQGETLGERLRRLRNGGDITLVGLSRMLGVSKPTIWKWENDESRPRQHSIEALANIFGISERELVFGNSERSRHFEEDGPSPQDANAELHGFVSDCRNRIAEMVGTGPENVSIAIQF